MKSLKINKIEYTINEDKKLKENKKVMQVETTRYEIVYKELSSWYENRSTRGKFLDSGWFAGRSLKYLVGYQFSTWHPVLHGILNTLSLSVDGV
jgi:hypothetical protein